ncbi:MAG: ABC transporter ATP-binding protein [Rhizobiales bacterium]|nr:ABC transporter ATP-binding protein [Hyphomicrobiales bacterium]
MGSTSVRIDGVSKRFGDATAVDNVSVTIEKGEFFTLLGSSGCGKTTLLRIIAGFLRQTSGRIHFGSACVDDLAPQHRNTGMVFQSYAIFPHLTVVDNIAYGLRARRQNSATIKEKVDRYLELTRLSQLGHRRPRELSGGQQQRVVLARAMVIEPDVLLMDEPLSNLDTEMRIHLRAEIRALQRQVGITTIYVTHDQEEALLMSDRIAVMRAGRFEQVSTPHEIYNNPKTRFVASFIGENNFLPARRLGKDGPDRVALETPGGRLVVKRQGEFTDSDVVDIAIRPQDIDVAPAGASGDLTGALVDIQFLGGTVRYAFDLGEGHVIQVAKYSRSNSALPEIGARRGLTIAPDAVRLFAPERNP